MKRSFPRSMGPPSGGAAAERTEWPLDPGDFAAYHRFSPTALAVRECLRLRAVRKFELSPPILDIGCGDGLFAALAYPGKQIWGLDINLSEIRRAQASSAYEALVYGSITNVTLPEDFFRSAIANCSLEHVPGLDQALRNIRRSLVPGGTFINIVPTPQWTRLMAIPQVLERAGFPSLAAAYGRGIDTVFNHIHLYDAEEWGRRLENTGFKVTSVEMLTSQRSSWVFDILLYPSLVGWLTKKLTGRWVLAPALRNLSVDATRHIVDAIAAAVPDSDEGSEYLIVSEAAT
jgi:SAM-dependent methyltransferase